MSDTAPPRIAPGIALVTGGGTGLGKHMARALAGAGYTVVITGRRAEVLAAAAAELGANVHAFAADISDPLSVKALFDHVKATFGRLDVLVNNAGMGLPPGPLEDISFADWSAVVAANLTGAFLCTQGAFRLMKEQVPRGGRIINNGSISATTPRPFSIAYTATKHAVTGLTKSTALDGRAYDIACGQIDIGNAASDMTATISKGIIQANGSVSSEPTMDPVRVGEAIVHMANLPLSVNILSMTIMATKMPFVGRG